MMSNDGSGHDASSADSTASAGFVLSGVIDSTERDLDLDLLRLAESRRSLSAGGRDATRSTLDPSTSQSSTGESRALEEDRSRDFRGDDCLDSVRSIRFLKADLAPPLPKTV